MTEKRKQELRRLLEEAMGSLEIRSCSGDWSLMCLEEFTKHLRHCWTTYSKDAKAVVFRFRPTIISNATESKLLGFIEEELSGFIQEGRILSATFRILGGFSDGIRLFELLQQLLRIAIAWGVDRAVSDFHKCTVDASASFRTVALIEGVTLDEQKQVLEGIQLTPMPESVSELPRYLPPVPPHGISEEFYCSKTLLVIDYSISPIFHKPNLPAAKTVDEYDRQKDRFQVKFRGGEFPEFSEAEFYGKFSEALSLACNFPVQITQTWEWLAADEFFNVNHGVTLGTTRISTYRLFGKPTELEAADVEKAKCLYQRLVGLDSDVMRKLRTPIGRWMKSKAGIDSVDKIIDLGIALEAFYLPGIKDELTFRLGVRAAWYLGKDGEHRKQLLTAFGDIYRCRSNAVHNGQLGKTAKFGGTSVPISELIECAQDLCRESILRVLEDERFPDWDSLILGGNS